MNKTTKIHPNDLYPNKPTELASPSDVTSSASEFSVTMTDSTSTSKTSDSDDSTGHKPLHFRVVDIPPWKQSIFLAFQQTMICISGILTAPYLVSEIACAGSYTIALRVKLISSTFVVTGITTLLQTVIGLRLPILQGPSFAFFPPLYAYASLPELKCNYSSDADVPEQFYLERMQTIQGSLALSSLLLLLIGSTGAIGAISKLIGPITIFPLLTLLCLGNVNVIVEKVAVHWIGVIQFALILLFVVFLCELGVPLPYYSRRRIRLTKYRLFGEFPYLISLFITYIIALILGFVNVIPKDSEARIDKVQSMNNLKESPWFQVPYPGQFGMPQLSAGLFLGMLASCVACSVESLGAYGILAKICEEKKPSASTLSRAIFIEGIGCGLAGLMGIGVGITTYSENVAAISITRVASRFTMQVAGVILIGLGVFTKVGAVLATIPDPMVGGVLCMGVCMISGVAISNMEFVSLKSSRNLTIMGVAIIVGMVIPDYFTEHPVKTSVDSINQMLNILLTIRMFVGGFIAFILDNTVRGTTREQRGFRDPSPLDLEPDKHLEMDGYSFPECVNRVLLRVPFISRLPFMPSVSSLKSAVSLQSLIRERNQ